MTQSSSSNNASASSSAPPPLQQFTLEELIRVLQNHRIEVISPHQQMQNGEHGLPTLLCTPKALTTVDRDR